MACDAFAHGAWALLHSADLMRLLITDAHGALAERAGGHEHGSRLYGSYAPRIAKTSHNRPLPLPDALLQGAAAAEPEEAPSQDIQWLASVSAEPWLWKLQWATLSVLFVSAEFRDMLKVNCPKRVATLWLDSFEERLALKMLGESTEHGSPEETAALTPLATVVSEIMYLKMLYEQQIL